MASPGLPRPKADLRPWPGQEKGWRGPLMLTKLAWADCVCCGEAWAACSCGDSCQLAARLACLQLQLLLQPRLR
eukprot:11944088-Alexandrium_andersonii.AAC.1